MIHDGFDATITYSPRNLLRFYRRRSQAESERSQPGSEIKMLSRRNMLLAGAALAAGGVSGRAVAAPARARKLRIGYLLPIESQIGVGATTMAEAVYRRTGGRIQIEQFPDSTLGGEVEMLHGVQLGTIDLAFITGAPLPNILPEAGIFNIPFLFSGLDHAHAVLDGPIGDSYLQLLSGKDMVGLAWGENGMRHITNSKRPIAAPDDLRGLKLRVPESPVMLLGFRVLGADANSLPFPQLYAALQAGMFDGQENPIATILSAKFAQVQRFLTLSGHIYDPAVIVMSSDAHDDLSAEDKVIMLEAAKTGASASRAFAAAAEVTGLVVLKDAGMKVLTNIDRARFAAAMGPATPEFEKMFGRRQIEQIRQAA
jgi:TRAP-type transport system periplasmic protein